MHAIWCSLSFLLPAALKNVANSLSMFYRGLKVQALNRHQILSLLIVVLHLYVAIPGATIRINQQMNSQYEK
jgi:hypothetical protein